MAQAKYDVLGIGNAIFDVLVQTDEGFLKRHGMTKRSNRFIRQATGMAIVSEPDTRIIKRNFFPYER